MDLLKIAELDDQINQFRENCPLDLFVMIAFQQIDFSNLPPDFKENELNKCANFVDEITKWVEHQEPRFYFKIRQGLGDLLNMVTLQKDNIYDDLFHYQGKFLENFGPYSISEDGVWLLDRNTGYPIDVDVQEVYLAMHHNPSFKPGVTTLKYLFKLLIESLTNILETLNPLYTLPNKPQTTPVPADNLPIPDDLERVLVAERHSHKMLLLHELGVIEYLIKKYGQKIDIAGIAKLLTFITKIDYETVRSGIRQYKNGSHTDIYTGNAVKAINKILVDVNLPPLEYKKIKKQI